MKILDINKTANLALVNNDNAYIYMELKNNMVVDTKISLNYLKQAHYVASMHNCNSGGIIMSGLRIITSNEDWEVLGS